MKKTSSAQLQKRADHLRRHQDRWRQTLVNWERLRLGLGLSSFVCIAIFASLPQQPWQAAAFATFFGGFVFAILRTRNVARHLAQIERLQIFCDRQRLRKEGLPVNRPSPRSLDEESNRQDPSGTLSKQDLHLFGSHSLWTLIDETLTDGGQEALQKLLQSNPLSVTDLRQRQARLKSLRSEYWFYVRLGLTAKSAELNLSTRQVADFLAKPFVHPKYQTFFWLNLFGWLITIFAIAISVTTSAFSPGIFVVGFLLLSFWSLNTVAPDFRQAVGLVHYLELLSPIFGQIEQRTKSKKSLSEIFPITAQKGPAQEVKKLETTLGFVGTQTNPILHFVLNSISPWTVSASFFLERKRLQLAADLPRCLEELAAFEVWGSLVIFDRWQTQTYPEFSESTSGDTLKFRGLYHPLIPRATVVANDFQFPAGQNLGLLTGSNMSGKSTFLRTLGINQILANLGAPVFAEEFHTRALIIATCIEVSDSLRDGHSYFYAEVRRLRRILKLVESNLSVLFLIDEIFRGTNNRERQIGSRAVIRSLAQHPASLGFVSTHDLELTSLGQTETAVVNLHFRETIDEQGQMHFHYKLQQGPTETTNALTIMRQEGLRVDLGYD